jgi:transposase-like protein
MSKSAKIRAALTATPDKPVAEIAKENGVAVGLVYNVKANMKKKSGAPKGKRGRKPGPKVAAKATAPQGVHNALDAAFEFIHKVGGVFHAEQLIAKLKSLKEKL